MLNPASLEMPSEILSRIPLPSLRTYTTISVLLVTGCIYYSFNVTSDPYWKLHTNSTSSAADALSNFDDSAVLRGENSGIGSEDGGPSSGNLLNDLNIANTINDLAAAIANMERKNGLVDQNVVVADVETTDGADGGRITTDSEPHSDDKASSEQQDETSGDNRSILDMCRDIASFMSQEPVCIWVSCVQ